MTKLNEHELQELRSINSYLAVTLKRAKDEMHKHMKKVTDDQDLTLEDNTQLHELMNIPDTQVLAGVIEALTLVTIRAVQYIESIIRETIIDDNGQLSFNFEEVNQIPTAEETPSPISDEAIITPNSPEPNEPTETEDNTL